MEEEHKEDTPQREHREAKGADRAGPATTEDLRAGGWPWGPARVRVYRGTVERAR